MKMLPSSVVADVVDWIESNRSDLSDYDRRTLMGDMLRALSGMNSPDLNRIIRNQDWPTLASIVEQED